MGAIVKSGSELMIKSIGNLSNSFILMPNTIDSVLSAVPNIINKIISNIAGKNPVMTRTGAELFTSLIGDMPDIVGKISGSVPEITDTILQKFINFIPEMSDTGNKFFTSLISNLPEIISEITGKIPEITEKTAEAVTNSEGLMSDAGYDLFCAITNPLPLAAKEIAQAPGQIVSILLARFMSLTKQFKSIGENIVYGVWDGISSMGSWLSSSVTGFFQGIVNGVTGFLGIHSPSKLFSDLVGKNIALGVKAGIDNEMSGVIDNTQTQMSKLANAAAQSSRLNSGASDILGRTNTSDATEMHHILKNRAGNENVQSIQPEIRVVMESTGATRDIFEALDIEIKRVQYLNGGARA